MRLPAGGAQLGTVQLIIITLFQASVCLGFHSGVSLVTHFWQEHTCRLARMKLGREPHR